MRRRVGLVGGALVFILLTPGTAMAHGIGGRLDLPVPVSYFIAAAGVVIVASFVALAVLWPEPRLQDGPRHEPAEAHDPAKGIAPLVGRARSVARHRAVGGGRSSGSRPIPPDPPSPRSWSGWCSGW